MKVASYTICHYGASYLNYSLRSVRSIVDKSYVFFTSHPSHGHKTDTLPIESRDELMASIPANEWDKLVWIDVDSFWSEGPQRDYAVKTLIQDGFDAILVLDYDEVWHSQTLNSVLDFIWQQNKARRWLLNFRHLWRSFNYIIEDDAWPVRVIDTRHADGIAYIPRELTAYHFGYAVTDAVMRYKWQCHGHKDELRPDWFTEKWQAWPPVEDCHPTNGRKENGEGWWNPKPFDKWMLPSVMCDHPFFNLERID